MTSKVAALLVVALLALVACGQGDDAASPPRATAAPASVPASEPDSEPAPDAAVPGGKVGAKGSGCKLPVEFEIAEEWTAEAVASLPKKGDLTLACEIDAKPAGNIGFLRVWTSKTKGPKKHLQAYLGKDAIKPVYTEIKLGGRPAVEVAYQMKSELDGSLEEERAFAVGTGKGTVVVILDSLDRDEHAAMLPAYELAKKTLTV